MMGFDLLGRDWDFGSSMQATVWVAVGLLVLTFALPRRARAEVASP
ncbi:hypothetical protein [Nonomuraea mesophila]|nr:hypothetical protein [Nonomuraea mesophila]